MNDEQVNPVKELFDRLYKIGHIAVSLACLDYHFLTADELDEATELKYTRNRKNDEIHDSVDIYLLDNELQDALYRYVFTGKKEYADVITELRRKTLLEDKKLEIDIKSKIKSSVDTHGYVYILKSLGLYKIGRAKDITSRYNTYKTENPHGIEMVCNSLVMDAPFLERFLLETYKKKLVKGREWFDLSPEEVISIKETIKENRI